MSNRPNFAHRRGQARVPSAVGLSAAMIAMAVVTEQDPDQLDVVTSIVVPSDADPPLNATFVTVTLDMSSPAVTGRPA